MIAKVRTDIANPQTSTAGLQVLGMLVGRLVKHVNLKKNPHYKKAGMDGKLYSEIILLIGTFPLSKSDILRKKIQD